MADIETIQGLKIDDSTYKLRAIAHDLSDYTDPTAYIEVKYDGDSYWGGWEATPSSPSNGEVFYFTNTHGPFDSNDKFRGVVDDGGSSSSVIGNEVYILNTVIPTPSLSSAQNIETSSATLYGEVNRDGGEEVDYKFRWKRTSDSTWTEQSTWIGSYTMRETFNEEITGLDSGTEYEFQLSLQNSEGQSNWTSSNTFTTVSGPPEASALPATDVTSNSANLKGEITSDSGEETEGRFRYWKSD